MKILKNNTAANILINDTGISIPALGSYTIQITEYLLWAASADVISKINSGNITVNDGVSNLNTTEGLSYIAYPDHALGGRFNNEANGFVATNIQAAIEEAKATSTGTSLIPEVAIDPSGAVPGQTWVLAEGAGSPVGLLLTLTQSNALSYKLSYKTASGAVKRTTLT
jgi:hypothetical protein